MFPFDVSGSQRGRSTLAKAYSAYRMRWKRRRLLYRSWKRRAELTRVSVEQIPDTGVLVFATVRNEMLRLEHWFGSAEYLADQPDVSLWTTPASYKASRFGLDWLTCLQWRFGADRWCLTVDADELLVYPDHDVRGLPDLTAHLEQQGQASVRTLMLDLYPKGSVGKATYVRGQDPVPVIPWFDADNYRAKIHPVFDNLWIQGGVRDRMFFGSQPERAPTLNKTPLVKWRKEYAYVTSTHQILPRRLSDVFDLGSGDRVTGVLLHTKFLPNIAEKSAEEIARKQHFENSDLYQPYYAALMDEPDLWTERSVRYESPDQLIALKLMSRGNWC